MKTDSAAYAKANRAFKDTCRVLFKEEIGELCEFEEYLKECMFPFQVLKSHISGRDVVVPAYYPQKARIISQDEVGGLEFSPLDVNQVKDIDTLLEAVNENVRYCGNRLFGKNENVGYVDNAIDCMNVLYSHNTWKCKNSAFLSCTRENEYSFGVSTNSSSRFMLHTYHGIKDTRCFGGFFVVESSDCFSCFNCASCSEALFSFNLRSKRNTIGNLELPRERYLGLKEKLVAEIAEKLKKDKKFVSIEHLSGEGGKAGRGKTVEGVLPPAEGMEEINGLFSATSRIVLGKELGPIAGYEGWLTSHSAKVKLLKGAFGKPVLSAEGWLRFGEFPASRLVSQEEALKLGEEKKIVIEEGEEPGLAEILRKVSDIAYYTCEWHGRSEKAIQCPIAYDSHTVYRVVDSTGGKKSGCASQVAYSEHIFGGAHSRIFQSRFCIKGYDSVNANNCFEIDNCHDASHSMFCHNCENVSDCLFCFNTKNKRYCVGNTEVGREEFLRVKKILLDYVVGKLEKDKDLELGIFNIGK